MEYAILLLTVLCAVLLVLLLLRKPPRQDPEEIAAILRKDLQEQMQQTKIDLQGSISALGQLLSQNQQQSMESQRVLLTEFDRNITETIDQFRKVITDQISLMEKSQNTQQERLRTTTADQVRALQESLSAQNQQFRAATADQMRQMEHRLQGMQDGMAKSLSEMRSTISENMGKLREENSKKLDEIRGTVDEKLQTTLEKRITESFKTVSEQLEQVYKGLGEMQNIASDVGGLKKVLSGVKTRGILGEIQLGAILEEILAPEQYDTNVATVPGSTERVEFAVKLPGESGTVYLPIDSKFPGDRYAQLLQAQESGDKAAMEAAYKALEAVIRSEAKDISSKYVEVPYTTNFGIMFLPFEGLYAEVVNRGLVEILQRDYKVNVAGPSTMAALLNSLQMGFRTLAIQKRSNEVWEVLGAVKTEFGKFEEAMGKMKKHLDSTSSELDKLIGTRTRAITRKLREVQQLDEIHTSQILELTSPEE